MWRGWGGIDDAMNDFGLPPEAVEFLKHGRQFDYEPADCEPGKVGLKRFDQLTLGEVWVGTDMDGDPRSGEDGYYAVPAVSLTGECKHYDPEFILLWMPQEEMFGSWDCDHWVLIGFPDFSWKDIEMNPARFLNAQWDPESEVAAYLQPWHSYEFKAGRPF